jgi:tetratricopeptide (TPR) repeat protein
MQKIGQVFLVLVLITSSVLAFAQSKEIDSLRQLLPDTKGQERADLLLMLSGKAWMADPIASSKYAQQALEVSEQEGYKKGIIRSLLYWSTLSSRQGEYALTEELALRVIEIAQEENEVKYLAQGRLTLGSMLIMTGEYARSYEIQLAGLDNARELGDRYLERSFLLNVGVIQMELDDLDEAEDYFNQALKLLEEDGKLKEAGGIYINLGLIERERKNFGSAIENSKKALEIFLENDDKYHISLAWSNIGLGWQLLGEHQTAIEHFDKSIGVREEIGDKSGLGKTTFYKASSLKELGRIGLAENLANEALAISEELGTWELTRDIYEFLYGQYEENGDLEKAFASYKEYTDAQDTINLKTNRDKLAELSTKHEVDELKSQNLLQVHETEIADLKVRQRNLLIVGMLILLILLAVIFFILQKRTNTKLEESRTDFLKTEKKSQILRQELEAERRKLKDFTEEMLAKSADHTKVAEVDAKDRKPDSEDIERIIEKLNSGIINDKDWVSFNMLFEAAYPDFARGFKEKVPEGTHNHQRLAALAKIQLSNKEIATIFNISRDSVVRAKYRLRQKMCFETNQEMEDYLKNL